MQGEVLLKVLPRHLLYRLSQAVALDLSSTCNSIPSQACNSIRVEFRRGHCHRGNATVHQGQCLHVSAGGERRVGMAPKALEVAWAQALQRCAWGGGMKAQQVAGMKDLPEPAAQTHHCGIALDTTVC